MDQRKPNTYYYKFLAKNISWLYLGRIAAKFSSLLLLPIMTLYLSPEDYGAIALFIVEAGFLSGLFDLGLSSFAGRMIYKFERRNKRTCSQYIGVMFLYIMMFSILGLLLVAPFVRAIARFMLKGVNMPNNFFYYVPLIYAFFLQIFSFSTNCFLQLQMNKKLFLCEILEFLLIAPLQVIGLMFLNFSWSEVVILQLFGKIISSLFSLYLVRKEMSFSFKRLRILKYALKYSLPMMPIQFAGILQQNMAKIFLVNMSTVSSVGIYSIGAKLSEVFSFLSRPIMTTIKPEISKRLDIRSHNLQNDITELFNIFFHLALFSIFIVSIFSHELIYVFVNDRYSRSLFVIPFMMFTYMFSELTGIFNIKIRYKNKTAFFTIITFLGVVCNGFFNYFLIMKFDIIGAALATLSTALVTFFATYIMSQKLHYSRYNLGKNFTILLFISIMIGLIQKYTNISLWMFVIKSILCFVYSLILYKIFSKSNSRFIVMKELVLKKIKQKFKLV